MPFDNGTSAAAGGTGLIPVLNMGGKVRFARGEFNFASDVAGTYTAPIKLPKGAMVIGAFINSSISLGSTTLAIGISGAAGKYRAAATYTSTDTTTWLGLNAALGEVLTDAEQIIITTASATAPSSGRLLIGFFYVDNS